MQTQSHHLVFPDLFITSFAYLKAYYTHPAPVFQTIPYVYLPLLDTLHYVYLPLLLDYPPLLVITSPVLPAGGVVEGAPRAHPAGAGQVT